MKLIGSFGGACRALAMLLVPAAAIAVSINSSPAYGQRVFGLDTSSAANFDVTQEQWNAAYNSGYAPAGIASFQFAIVRSSHGGTDGVSPASDDSQLYQNISRATTAGMLAGSYHYPHANVYTAADEAQHYLNHAGMYMKPGYLLPVLDLEGKAGIESGVLSQADLTTWSIDFINAINATTGVNPIVYTSSSFNTDEVTAAVAFTNIASSPHTGERTYQWLARPSGSILTGDPGAASGYPDPYGGWDPNYTTKSASTDPAIKPWAFWQNGSAHIAPTDSSGNPNASGHQFLIDFDAANGNIEFVKDFLVPNLWGDWNGPTNAPPDTPAGTPISGNWTSQANWNSNNPGYNGAIENGPASRLPNSLDWVKLQWSGGGTVTLSSGAQSVRKFYTQQPLNITGGSLSVGYIPGSGGKWDLPSEFNAAVTISSGASYSAQTTQVDGGGGQFNINGGTVTFSVINLVSNASNAGKIVMGGDATFAQTGGAGTSIIRSTGNAAVAGNVSLGSANRTFTVNNGSASIDLSIQAAVTGTGGLVKAGTGTLQLAGTNTYTGGTTLTSGTLLVTKDLNFGAAPGIAQASNITLNGGTLKTGSELTSLSLSNPGSGYTSFPTVSFGGAGADAVAPSANVLGKISSIQVTAGGTTYTGTAKVVIVGGGGTGATATATMALDSTGVTNKVASITITNQGSGYTSVPTVYITDGSGQGVAGSGAAAVVNGVTLTGMSLNSSGFDYASPAVTLSGGGGSGAAATASSTTSLTLNNNRGISLTANGGTLYQTAGTTLSVGGIISSTGNGTLTKSGTGTLVLSGANTYTGATTVSAGVLNLSGANARLGSGNVTVLGTTGGTSLVVQAGVTDAINDGATLSLLGGGFFSVPDYGFANLGAGINEAVASLLLGGTSQANGLTYGSTASSALIKSDEYFAGTGLLSVGLPGDFNNDNSVDAADYVVWQKSPSTFGGSSGYDLWRTNFGTTSPGAGSSLDGGSVPEPSSFVLLMLGIAALANRRRGR
jgi:autotransporter-associated beta strand protein